MAATTKTKDIDYSQPLATLLKEGTREAHDAIENSQGAKLLLSGTLAKSEYIKFLMLLWHVYNAMEQALDKHASHPALEPTYNPTLLARTSSLSADIAHLLEVDEDSWQSHPIHQSLTTPMPAPLLNFIDRLNVLSNAADPSPLLAHAYVRYLGDLSGGQNMRHIFAKSYGLDDSEGLGISFYIFKELKSSKPAGLGEMKRIKEWYREGLNKAGEIVPASKPAIVEEASRAFRLNAGLFDLVQAITLEDEANLSDSKELEESKVVYDASQSDSEGGYQMTSFLAVVAAVCLAHFILVVGGFTGNAGYQKLLAVEEWLSNIWSQQSSASSN